MKKRWVHPWWLHLPALTMLGGFVVYTMTRLGTWPDRVPFRFGTGGVVDWGSAWGAFALVVGLGILFIALSMFLDELWALQERTKRFNAMTLLDELVIGLLVGIQAPWFEASTRGASEFRFPWAIALLCVAGGVAAATFLERARPFEAMQPVADDPRPEAFGREVAARLARGERVVYWDVQNPRYVTVFSLGIPAVLWIGAGFTFGSEPWAGGILAAVGVVLLQFYGGQRVRVTKDHVTIRYGLAGVRVFRCETRDIASVGIRRFAALQEFGGYGIRFSGSTVGFFLGGSQAVRIGRPGKRSVLIGSDHPQRLAAVLGAVSGVEPIASEGEGGDR